MRSDWLPSGHYFLVMTGHYENVFFSAKFGQDLGVIKTKIGSFSYLLSPLVLITRPGFSLFSEHDLEMTSLIIRWEMLPLFFQC